VTNGHGWYTHEPTTCTIQLITKSGHVQVLLTKGVCLVNMSRLMTALAALVLAIGTLAAPQEPSTTIHAETTPPSIDCSRDCNWE
jgi:hypothetical protein